MPTTPRTRCGRRTGSSNPRRSTPTTPSPNPSRHRANMNISARYIRAWLERSSSNPPGNHRDNRPDLARPAIEDPNAIQPMPRAKTLLTTMSGRTLWSHRKTRPTWTCSSLTGLQLTPRSWRKRQWRYRQGDTEPTLDEVIHEPVIRLMMERDHVTEEALLRILDIVRQHLGGNHEQQRQGTGQLLPNPLLH